MSDYTIHGAGQRMRWQLAASQQAAQQQAAQQQATAQQAAQQQAAQQTLIAQARPNTPPVAAPTNLPRPIRQNPIPNQSWGNNPLAPNRAFVAPPVPGGGEVHSQLSQLDPALAEAVQFGRNQAGALHDTRHIPYVKERFAGAPHEQTQAEHMAQHNMGSYLPYLQRAGAMNQAATSTTPENIQRYMNPYQQNVVDRMAELANRNLRENILPMLSTQFASTGTHGSTMHANLAARAAREMQNELSQNQKVALAEGYHNAAEMYHADQERLARAAALEGTLGQSAQKQALQDMMNLYHIADVKRNQQQQLRDFEYEEFEREIRHPQEQLNRYISHISGAPYVTQHYSVAPKPPTALHGKDYGLAALQNAPSLFNMFFGNR